MQPHYSQSCCSGKLINTFNWGCFLLIYFTACGSEINTNRWKRPQQLSCRYPQTSSCLFLEEEEEKTHPPGCFTHTKARKKTGKGWREVISFSALRKKKENPACRSWKNEWLRPTPLSASEVKSACAEMHDGKNIFICSSSSRMPTHLPALTASFFSV